MVAWCTVSPGVHNTIDGMAKQQEFIFSLFWGQKPQLKVPADSLSGEGSFPGLWTATFWLCPLMAFLSECAETENTLSGVSHKDTNPVRSEPHPYDLIQPESPP